MPYQVVDYTKQYESIMQFNKNKTVPIHQWYPFVEGYSKEFIESILAELDYAPEFVLEPFAGSGTTPLEMQSHGIHCYSFEVSPFMYLLSSVKMQKEYNTDTFNQYLNILHESIDLTLNQNIRELEMIPFGDTVVQNQNLKKWNFNNEVLNGILDIKYAIKQIPEIHYQNLFKIALASILIEVSNMFRNGKCLSYKKKWQERIKFTREDVHNIFFNRIADKFATDINTITQEYHINTKVNNSNLCFYGDVRQNISKIADNSIDLIITSPPYLNSRDYTDIYMLELKVLDLVSNHEDLRNLRKSTIRSHVQVKHGNLDALDIPLLNESISSIMEKSDSFWNNDLLNMIKGYFLDMDILFENFYRVMKPDCKIFFNVANSAYFGVEIKVDEIISQIAERKGFTINEIRKARDLKVSSQQAGLIDKLRESVTVMTR